MLFMNHKAKKEPLKEFRQKAMFINSVKQTKAGQWSPEGVQQRCLKHVPYLDVQRDADLEKT